MRGDVLSLSGGFKPFPRALSLSIFVDVSTLVPYSVQHRPVSYIKLYKILLCKSLAESRAERKGGMYIYIYIYHKRGLRLFL